jgi:hypothetical protein
MVPVFGLYTAFTLIAEQVGLDSVNRALSWPSLALYVLAGYVAAGHGTFRKAVVVGTLMGMVGLGSGVVLMLAGAFTPAYPVPSATVVTYTLVGGLIFAAAGSALGAFAQRRLAAWGANRQHPTHGNAGSTET